MSEVIEISLLYNEDIKNKARKMIKGGTIIGFALVLIETGEVIDLVYNEGEARLYCMENNIKDDEKYASTLIKLQEVII